MKKKSGKGSDLIVWIVVAVVFGGLALNTAGAAPGLGEFLENWTFPLIILIWLLSFIGKTVKASRTGKKTAEGTSLRKSVPRKTSGPETAGVRRDLAEPDRHHTEIWEYSDVLPSPFDAGRTASLRRKMEDQRKKQIKK